MQRFLFSVVLSVSSAVSLTACGGSDATTTNDLAIQAATVSAAEKETVLFVREEEKLARDVYTYLYQRWQQPIFDNIGSRSEQQHMDSIKVQLDALGLADPVVDNSMGSFTNPDLAALYQQLTRRGETTLNAAFKVGAFIEEYDIDDLEKAYKEVTANSQQSALLLTYLNLTCGSRNHLRSFVRQIELNGEVYEAQLLPQAIVDQIVDSDMENCGTS